MSPTDPAAARRARHGRRHRGGRVRRVHRAAAPPAAPPRASTSTAGSSSWPGPPCTRPGRGWPAAGTAGWPRCRWCWSPPGTRRATSRPRCSARCCATRAAATRSAARSARTRCCRSCWPTGSTPRSGRDPADGTAVLLVGRGSTDPDANAEVCKVARLLQEGRGLRVVETAFVSLARPDVPAGLDRCARARRPPDRGRARTSCSTACCRAGSAHQARAFGGRSTRTLDVRAAGHLGDCDELAELVVERYREALHGDIRMNCDTCAYRVLLPGFEDKLGAPQTPHHHPDDPSATTGTGTGTATAGGRVSDRGAVPGRARPRRPPGGRRRRRHGRPAPDRRAARGRRGRRGGGPGGDPGGRGHGHRAGAALDRPRATATATSTAPGTRSPAPTTPAVNAAVGAEAQRRRVFCVRADDAPAGSAVTPAVGRHDGLTVGVLAGRRPAALGRRAHRAGRGAAGRAGRRHRGAGAARGRAGRRRPRRPRADHRARPAAAGPGRRRGHRPARPARPAGRARPARRGDRRVEDPVRPGHEPGPDQRAAGRRTPGPAGSWCGSRAGTPTCSAAASRRCSPAPRPASRSPWCPG